MCTTKHVKIMSIQQWRTKHTCITYTRLGWTDIYMDMRLGPTEVIILLMAFGSLVTRRNPIPCCPSDDSVTAHNIQHAQDRGHHTP